MSAGLMLGIIFSTALPSKNEILNTKSGLTDKPQESMTAVTDAPSSLNIKLTSSPTAAIKAAGKLSASKELNQIDKATISVKYDNTTSRSFNKTFVKFIVRSKIEYGMGALPDGLATPNSKAQSKETLGIVFDIPDINPNSTNEAEVFLFGRERGEISVTAVIVSNDIVLAESDPIKILVN